MDDMKRWFPVLRFPDSERRKNKKNTACKRHSRHREDGSVPVMHRKAGEEPGGVEPPSLEENMIRGEKYILCALPLSYGSLVVANPINT